MKNIPCTYAEMMKQIKEFKNSPVLTVTSLGRSLVGRSIPLIRLGNGEKSVLYVGSHHGMEWMTTMLLLKYLSEIITSYDKKGSILGCDTEELLKRRTVYVLPMLNPDGVELQINGCDPMNPLFDRLHRMSGGNYEKWQANGRGVDLNHNYNAGFDEYKKLENELGITAGATKFSGSHPESEPETACLCSFIRTVEPSMLIALHTQGSEIYYDYNGKCPPSSLSIAKRMERLSGYTVSRPDGTACYGGLKDWFISEFDRPAFTIECGKGENPLPITDFDAVYSVIRGILHLGPTFV